MRASMMTTALAAVALLALALTPAAHAVPAYAGYPLTTSTPVGSFFTASYEVTAADLANRGTGQLTLRVSIDSLGTANLAAVDFYYAKDAALSTSSTLLGSKTTTQTSTPTYNIVIANATGFPGAGTYNFGGYVKTCATCSTYSVTISSGLYLDGQQQPFTAVHNPYTPYFSVSSAAFAAPSARHIVAASTTSKIFIKLTKATGRGSQDVFITYNANAVATTLPTTMNATLTGSGPYSTGQVVLTEGTWYIAPYCVSSGSTVLTGCNFAYAIGIDSEPSAAARASTLSVFVMAAAIVASLIATLL